MLDRQTPQTVRARRFWSPGAAAKFRHVHVESLCGEFQSLDRGQIGKDRLAERLRRHADLQCHHERLDTVCPLRRYDHAARQAIGLRIRDQLES